VTDLAKLVAQRGLHLQLHETTQSQAQWLATRTARALHEALQQRGRASLALSGGRSPIPLLQALNCLQLAWEKIGITLVDERWVALDHADSNAGLLWRHMPAVMPRVQWLPLYHGVSAQQDAEISSEALRDWQPLDVVVLGMGSDGHTASLFPGADNLAQLLAPDAPALCMPSLSSGGAQRLTLTGAALHSARLQLLAISGEDKASTLAAALAGQQPQWPISAFLRPPLQIAYSASASR